MTIEFYPNDEEEFKNKCKESKELYWVVYKGENIFYHYLTKTKGNFNSPLKTYLKTCSINGEKIINIPGITKLRAFASNKFLQEKGKPLEKLLFKHEENNVSSKTSTKKIMTEIQLLKYKKQIILQGSPGTGKTRKAMEIAKEMAPDNYKLIQFHPAYTYEDFVRGIVATTGNGNINYKVKNKVLAEMAENAKNNPGNPFVLIIDEINRANLSSVLGELIYALEYRGEVEGMYEYQGSREIVLPENLYIIGTMNTADRSVGHIDYAIRRRFAFVDVNTDESVIPNEAMPLFEKVKGLFDDHLSDEFELNDVMIGHSYFLRNNLELALALEYEIKPMLQEYRKDGVLTCEEEEIKKLKIED
ncbi:hypothetical protein [uncultured Gammaproteobacteria bacterium]|nr:hypothetical protein [uncultured Gammaproteobacteria bacterium]CAC9616077.1 hypothetical protein [uncultured Gammaproteobacteria bacterium]